MSRYRVTTTMPVTCICEVEASTEAEAKKAAFYGERSLVWPNLAPRTGHSQLHYWYVHEIDGLPSDHALVRVEILDEKAGAK